MRDSVVRFARSALVPAFAAIVLASVPAARQRDGLREIAGRLERGDTSAIDELLARTRPSAPAAETPEDRLARLRAEVEVLRARRAARRSVFPAPTQDEAPLADEVTASGAVRVDPLREARAWLRAGDATRALEALADEGPQRLHLEARALEAMGRTSEAISALERVVREAESPLDRARAESDLAHLKWMEKRRSLRGGRP